MFQKATVGPPNKKSDQTVVSTVSGLQPVASTLVGTLGYDGVLGGKFGQVLPGARRLRPDGQGNLASGGLGSVGQVLQDLRLALFGDSSEFIATFSETSGSNSVVRSGPKLSVICGVFQCCFCQTAQMLGSPLPACSPTLMRLNILISDSLHGSDMPPTSASCMLMRNAPGLVMRMQSGHFCTTRLRRS